MLLAYFRIGYHRLEVAKKWISKAVLFRQVFRWSLAVLLPHCILEILESFWVPQSLWLESWKFSFMFVLVREGWALSGSPGKEKLDPDFQIAWFEFTWEIDLGAELRSLQSCSRGMRRERSSGSSSQLQSLKGAKLIDQINVKLISQMGYSNWMPSVFLLISD